MNNDTEIEVCENLAKTLEDKDWDSLTASQQSLVKDLMRLGYLGLGAQPGIVGKALRVPSGHWSRYLHSRNNFFNKFILDVSKEQERAKEKFPKSERLLGALMEEVGELAQALLKITESGESPQNVYDEAVQVASTVFRLAKEGEPDYRYPGMKCCSSGCTAPVLGGPCALCFE